MIKEVEIEDEDPLFLEERGHLDPRDSDYDNVQMETIPEVVPLAKGGDSEGSQGDKTLGDTSQRDKDVSKNVATALDKVMPSEQGEVAGTLVDVRFKLNGIKSWWCAKKIGESKSKNGNKLVHVILVAGHKDKWVRRL